MFWLRKKEGILPLGTCVNVCLLCVHACVCMLPPTQFTKEVGPS